VASAVELKRLYGFGLLPLVPGAPAEALSEAVSQLATQYPHIRGIIIGTRGIGLGLDDPTLEPLWASLAETGLVVFIHPHYGVDAQAWGTRDNGNVLPLALGFPFETTTVCILHPSDDSLSHMLWQTITRLILAGVLDRHPNLRLLLAHSGGALPQLSSRLASCIEHDPVLAGRLAHDARWYLGKLWFDAVAYGSAELSFVSEAVGRAGGYVRGGGTSVGGRRKVGASRMLFGTDHPFFPPLEETGKWRSVVENLDAIDGVEEWNKEDKDGVKGRNALTLFGLLLA
jgi:aminocarboxymuconate-semialdehyde decarboxylase